MSRLAMTAIAMLLLGASSPARPAPDPPADTRCETAMDHAASAASRRTPIAPRSSAAFVRQALACGREALHAAQEAIALATAEPVRAVAERLVVDHREANERLEALAQRKHWGSEGDTNIALPPVIDGEMPAGGVGSGLGVDYDRKFIDRQIDTHERVVALFRRQSRSGDDPDARRLAGQLLPTLEEQLAQLRHLRA